jgi:preprotein translocase subunit YajC
MVPGWIVLRTLASVTNRRATTALTPARRAAGLVAGLVLGVAVLAGCSSENASTDCGLDACTVTFDRGVEASANILGIEAKLISAQDDQVTVEVAGEQLTLTTGQQATEVGGFTVSVDSVTDSNVTIRVARNPGS